MCLKHGINSISYIHTIPYIRAISYTGDLFLPEDLTNTVPVVIFIHGTVGVDSRYEFHRKTMLDAGIATLELDLKTGIYDDYYSAPEGTRLQSAVYTALEVLQSLPDINPDKIAVMGFSLGGEIAMTVSSQIVENRYLKPGQPGFAGHVIFYPGCWWIFDPEKDKKHHQKSVIRYQKIANMKASQLAIQYIFWQENPMPFVKGNCAVTFQMF